MTFGRACARRRSGTKLQARPHSWCNLADQPLRMLIIFWPGRIEKIFKEIATRKSDDDIAVLADRFGCRVVGPPLQEGIYSVSSPALMSLEILPSNIPKMPANGVHTRHLDLSNIVRAVPLPAVVLFHLEKQPSAHRRERRYGSRQTAPAASSSAPPHTRALHAGWRS